MFKIQNGRLYPDVVPQRFSFKIPEGFWIETEPLTVSAFHITFWNPERDARVEIRLGEKMEETTSGELYKFFFASDAEFYGDDTESDEDDTAEKDGPYPVEYSGFSGHQAFHCSTVSQFCALLDISELGLKTRNGTLLDRLEIIILAGERDSVKGIVGRKSIRELLESFTVE